MAKLAKGLIAASEAPKPTAVAEQAAAHTAPKRPAREGKKMIAAWAEEEVSIELGVLAVRKKTTVQDLILRGIDLVFREEGMPEIASPKRGDLAA